MSSGLRRRAPSHFRVVVLSPAYLGGLNEAELSALSVATVPVPLVSNSDRRQDLSTATVDSHLGHPPPCLDNAWVLQAIRAEAQAHRSRPRQTDLQGGQGHGEPWGAPPLAASSASVPPPEKACGEQSVAAALQLACGIQARAQTQLGLIFLHVELLDPAPNQHPPGAACGSSNPLTPIRLRQGTQDQRNGDIIPPEEASAAVRAFDKVIHMAMVQHLRCAVFTKPSVNGHLCHEQSQRGCLLRPDAVEQWMSSLYRGAAPASPSNESCGEDNPSDLQLLAKAVLSMAGVIDSSDHPHCDGAHSSSLKGSDNSGLCRPMAGNTHVSLMLSLTSSFKKPAAAAADDAASAAASCGFENCMIPEISMDVLD